MNTKPRDYRQYPPEYDAVLRQFARDGTALFPFAEERDARHTTRELHRYIASLRAGVEAEPGNEHVRNLAEIARDVIVRCYKTSKHSVFNADTPWHVRLDLNPIVRQMREGQSALRAAIGKE